MFLARWWLVGLGVAALVVADSDSPYCSVRYRRLCQGKGRHIACQFPDTGAGPSCVNYTLITFGPELRHFITHYINRRRQRIAAGNERVRGGVHIPRPEIMMQVEWDRELATLAQRLANQCSFVHDDCRATVRYPYAGQTVGEVKWRRSSESDQQNAARAIRRVLDAWWGERRRVTARELTKPFRLNSKGTVWGHFSQLAVWSLRGVGCGAVRYGSPYPKMLLVCDFSHTNMLGQRTLSPGPLAACPIHAIRQQRSPYPLLCSPVRHPIIEEQDSGNQSEQPNQEYDVYAYDANYDDTDHLYDDLYVSKPTTFVSPADLARQRAEYIIKARNQGRQKAQEKDVIPKKGREKEVTDRELERERPNEKDDLPFRDSNLRKDSYVTEKENSVLRDTTNERHRVYDKEKPVETEKTPLKSRTPKKQDSIDKDDSRMRERVLAKERTQKYDDFADRVKDENRERENEPRKERKRTQASKEPPPVITKKYNNERDFDQARSQEREEILQRGRIYETVSHPENTREQTRVAGYVKPEKETIHRKDYNNYVTTELRENIPERRLQEKIRHRPVNLEREQGKYTQDDKAMGRYKSREDTKTPGGYFVRDTTRHTPDYPDQHRKEWNRISDPTRFPYLARQPETSSNAGVVFYEPVKRRWRPTRDRPDRPGAKALLVNTPPAESGGPSVFRMSTKPVIGFLKMDQDDAEQLYKDTGYNPLWKINKKITTA